MIQLLNGYYPTTKSCGDTVWGGQTNLMISGSYDCW